MSLAGVIGLLPYPGGLLAIRSADPSIASRLTDRFGGRLCSGGAATADVVFRASDLDAGWDEALTGSAAGNRLRIELSGARGEFDLETRTGEVGVSTTYPWFELKLENALRMILVELAAQNGSWIFHGAAAADPDLSACYVFFGPSGAGKSTTVESSAAAGYPPLNDDLLFLSLEGGDVFATGCAFHGKTSIRHFESGRFPVRAFFRLEKSDRDEVVPLGAANAVRELLSSLVSWRARTASEQREVIVAAEEIQRRAPVFRLFLRKGAGFWKRVHDELHGVRDGARGAGGIGSGTRRSPVNGAGPPG